MSCRGNGGRFREERGDALVCKKTLVQSVGPSPTLARIVSLGLWVSNKGEGELADNQVMYHKPDPYRLRICVGELGGGSPEKVAWQRNPAEQGRVV